MSRALLGVVAFGFVTISARCLVRRTVLRVPKYVRTGVRTASVETSVENLVKNVKSLVSGGASITPAQNCVASFVIAPVATDLVPSLKDVVTLVQVCAVSHAQGSAWFATKRS